MGISIIDIKIMVFNPGLIPILLGIFSVLFPRKLKKIIAVVAPCIAAIYATYLISLGNAGPILRWPTSNFEINLFKLHDYSGIFCYAFTAAALLNIMFFRQDGNNNNLISIILIYLGSSIAIIFCGDLISLFIFWEIAAISSTAIIMSNDKHGGPSLRYAYLHILSGVLLLCGIIIQASNAGTMEFTAMGLGSYVQLNPAQALILTAILINCAAPPFSAWIADSYPVASIYTIGFLSSFTTKFSLFALLNLFPGFQPLLYVGGAMVVYGIIMSLNSNNIQKILCYNIVNQLGMLIAVISKKEALAGIAISACCGIIYQSLFFMATGSVIRLTGKDRLISHAGATSLNIAKICMIIAGISMAALPFTIGFIGKAIMVDNIYENNILYMLLLTSNVGATLCSGIRLPYFLFSQADHSAKTKEKLPPNMQLTMLLGASLCMLIGLYPEVLYGLIPHKMHYKIYSADRIITQLQLILSTAAAFLIFQNILKPKDQYLPDFDWIYRVPGKRIILLANLFVKYLGITIQAALSNLHTKITGCIKGKELEKFIIKNAASSTSITLALATAIIGIYLVLSP